MSATKSKSRTYPRIKDQSKTLPRIEPSVVAEALGAEPTDLKAGSGGNPLSLFVVRQELMRRLQSTGGRPSLVGATSRKKIPLNDSQWSLLEKVASAVASPSFAPSAGQIASVLLTLSLQSIHVDSGQELEVPKAGN